MSGRWLLAVSVLMVAAVRCETGQPGVINVGSVIPPMPLRNTPTPWLETTRARPATKTPTVSPTKSPTPTPTFDLPSEAEPLEALPEVPPAEVPERVRSVNVWSCGKFTLSQT
jgi:hypothetical protein